MNEQERPKNFKVVLLPDRSAEAVAARRNRTAEMARAGCRPSVIASEVGVCKATVYHYLKKIGIPTVEARIGKAARIEVNKVMDALLSGAMPSQHALAILRVDWAFLDRTKFPMWIGGLDAIIKAHRQLRKRLKEDKQ